MNQKRLLMTFVLILALALSASVLAGTDGHEEKGELKHRVSTEGLSGLSLWLVVLYNDHRLAYAILTTLSMAVFGGLIALIVDFILARLGLTVSKMEHRE